MSKISGFQWVHIAGREWHSPLPASIAEPVPGSPKCMNRCMHSMFFSKHERYRVLVPQPRPAAGFLMLDITECHWWLTPNIPIKPAPLLVVSFLIFEPCTSIIPCLYSGIHRQVTSASYVVMSVTVNPFKFQTAKIFDKNKNDQDVHASECPITGTDMHLNQKIVKFGAAIVDDIPFKAKRSESRVSRTISVNH